MHHRLLLAFLLTSLAGAASAETIACASKFVAKSIPTQVPLLIFGEIHGTENAPEYVADVACARLKAAPDSKLTVALEYPMQESEHLQRYVNSSGEAKDRDRLLASPFWQREMQDGRSSLAMLTLIEKLRQWRGKAPGLRVTAFDPVEDQAGGPTRDEAMAVHLKQIVQETAPGLTIVLTGNLHARRTPGFGGRPDYKTMASVLAVPFQTYKLMGPRGAYWACTPLCGEQAFGTGTEPDTLPNYDLRTLTPSQEYDGVIDVGAFRIAKPAIGGASDALPADATSKRQKVEGGHD